MKDIIMGCSGIAGLYHEVSEEDAASLIKCALEKEVTQFDTAPHYGLGTSETRMAPFATSMGKIYTKVGRVVRQRSEVTSSEAVRVDQGNVPGVSSLFSHVPEDVVGVFDYTASGMRFSCAQSCARLSVSAVFGLRVHDCERDHDILELLHPDTGGLWELVRMREEGVICHVGLGMNDPTAALRILSVCPEGTLDSVLIAGAWNLLDQSALPLLQSCAQRRISVHVAGVYCSGLLVGGTHYQYSTASLEVRDRLEAWRALCAASGVELQAAALSLARSPRHLVQHLVLGLSSEAELRQSEEWLCQADRVQEELWWAARDQGLISTDVLRVLTSTEEEKTDKT
jgi:D-threo-aldose 1-dehydrogenase